MKKSSTTSVPRYALYVRVSSDEQREQQTIQTQFSEAERYCTRHGLSLVGTYADDGVSGTIPFPQRGGGAQLLADAEAGKFDTVLVFRLDRLARKVSVLQSAVEVLTDAGVSIRSMSEPFEVGTAFGNFNFNVLAAFAQFERDAFRERSEAGLIRAVREGKWTGGHAPYGYRVENKRLTVYEPEAAVVRQIFSLYLDGMRLRGITKHLNALGVAHPMDGYSKKRRQWYEATVSHLLRNTVYVGRWQWRKTSGRDATKPGARVPTDDARRITTEVPRIISDADFDEVQRMLRYNFANSIRNAKHFYLLRGLVKCGLCPYRYTGMGSGRKPWQKHFYRCSSMMSRPTCPPCGNRNVRADLLEEEVWRHCAEFIRNPGPVLEELRALLAESRRARPDYDEERARLGKVLAEIDGQRANVIRMARRGLISEEEYERELQQTQEEKEQLQSRLALLTQQDAVAAASEERLLSVEELLTRLSVRIDAADNETKREIVSALVDKVVITPGESAGGKKPRPAVRVTFTFDGLRRGSRRAIYVERGDATSSARLAASWPRTSRKSTA